VQKVHLTVDSIGADSVVKKGHQRKHNVERLIDEGKEVFLKIASNAADRRAGSGLELKGFRDTQGSTTAVLRCMVGGLETRRRLDVF